MTLISSAHRLFALWIAVALLFSAGSATASPNDAEEHYQRAFELLQERNLQAARREFEAAYAASPHHVVLYNLGKVSLELGDRTAARIYFTRYLTEGSDQVPTDRKHEVSELLRGLEADIASPPPGTPADATASSSPSASENPTRHETSPSTGDASSAPAAVGGPDSPVGVSKTPPVEFKAASSAWLELAESNAKRRSLRAVGVTLAALGAGLLATTAGLAIWNQSRARSTESDRQALSRNVPSGASPSNPEDFEDVLAYEVARTQNEGELESIRQFDIVTVVTGVTGGLLLGTGTTLFLLNRRPLELKVQGSSVSLKLLF